MNAFQQVAAVRAAQHQVLHIWATNTTYNAVVACQPAPVRQDPKVSPTDWAVAVETMRLPGEDPVAAAERIALYVTLHAERYGTTPSLASLTTRHLHDQEN